MRHAKFAMRLSHAEEATHSGCSVQDLTRTHRTSNQCKKVNHMTNHCAPTIPGLIDKLAWAKARTYCNRACSCYREDDGASASVAEIHQGVARSSWEMKRQSGLHPCSPCSAKHVILRLKAE